MHTALGSRPPEELGQAHHSASIQRWWDQGGLGARGPLAMWRPTEASILDHQALSTNRCLAPWVLLPGVEQQEPMFPGESKEAPA